MSEASHSQYRKLEPKDCKKIIAKFKNLDTKFIIQKKKEEKNIPAMEGLSIEEKAMTAA